MGDMRSMPTVITKSHSNVGFVDRPARLQWRSGGVAVAILALTMAGCARQAVQTRVVPESKMATAPYAIGKDDVIDVIVWKEPQLSGKVRVVALTAR
jgi:hypothetical protein